MASLPKFLVIEKEVTGDPAYSMYNLSLKEDWKNSKKYYTGGESSSHVHPHIPTNGKTEDVLAFLFGYIYMEMPHLISYKFK